MSPLHLDGVTSPRAAASHHSAEARNNAKPVQALVEIVGGGDATGLAALLRTLYRASQGGIIALLLRDITPDAVDKILDEIVPCFPLTIPGLVYLNALDEPAIVETASKAALTFVATDSFRLLIEANGIAGCAIDCASLSDTAKTELIAHRSSVEHEWFTPAAMAYLPQMHAVQGGNQL